MSDVLDTAHGISELGILIMISAVYIVITISLLGLFVKLFVNIVTKMLNQFQSKMDELLEETKGQTDKLELVSIGLRDESESRLRNLISMSLNDMCFDLVKSLCRIKSENHIDNKEATQLKIDRVIDTAFNSAKSKLSNYRYNRNTASEYLNPMWKEEIKELMIQNLYGEEFSIQKINTDFTLLFDGFKMKIYNDIPDN
jgi:hypothetical protein